jgi:hypothetical protein
MRRFLAPTIAVAGMTVAVTLLGGPASAAPEITAAPHSTNPLAGPDLPSPPPPAIPPPRCVREDQSDGTYEWRYSSTRTLGDTTVHEFYISYAGRSTSPFELSQEVTCTLSTGRAGSGLGL